MIKFNFYLTKKQMWALSELARKTGLTIAEHIRRAIDKYLKEIKNE